MINKKYYEDIKKFPAQFKEGFNIAKDLKVEGEFNRIVLCGVGGSSWYGDLINDFLDSEKLGKIRLEVKSTYEVPFNADEKTLFIISSYSGNTEEALSCLDQVEKKKLSYVVFTSGGKLLDRAKVTKVPLFKVPASIQPRLSTGYTIAGVIKLLENIGLIVNKEDFILDIAEGMDKTLDEDKAKNLAKKLIDKVPLVYGTDNNISIAKASKIKFNEDAKVQSFYNYFPEIPHNEMEGFTNLIMEPYFIIYKSKFTHPRNHKRIEVFTKLMQKKSLPVEILDLKGKSVFAEMMNVYYFISHVAYYLAEENNIDPEPVKSVEDFKRMLNE
ncbi:MAG: bifunctional phosphoglucose/phosphomannose isomerase [Candidatus Woesearchaeota archaeon]